MARTGAMKELWWRKVTKSMARRGAKKEPNELEKERWRLKEPRKEPRKGPRLGIEQRMELMRGKHKPQLVLPNLLHFVISEKR
jgi:hypothetical protein